MRVRGRALFPALILTFGMLVIGGCAALLAVSMSTLGLHTALFATVPGRITEMSSVGASLGADGAAVLSVHLIWLIITIAIINLFLARGDVAEARSQAIFSNGNELVSEVVEKKVGRGRVSLLLAAGACGGIAGITSGIPAGGVVGALICSAGVRM